MTGIVKYLFVLLLNMFFFHPTLFFSLFFFGVHTSNSVISLYRNCNAVTLNYDYNDCSKFTTDLNKLIVCIFKHGYWSCVPG